MGVSAFRSKVYWFAVFTAQSILARLGCAFNFERRRSHVEENGSCVVHDRACLACRYPAREDSAKQARVRVGRA